MDPKNINCNDRDRILENGTPAEWAALEAHSATCPACAEELRAWKALSAAAAELRDYSDSPSLWPRIQGALVQEAASNQGRANRWAWLHLGSGMILGWQVAAAAALVLLLSIASVWVYTHNRSDVGRARPDVASSPLLKSPALAEVERTQSAYEQAIDKLAAEAKSQIENPATPLQESYREKLLVLDSAIEDLRAQAGLNPSNAHLRQQLLAMYQEKQQTLQDILEEKR
jgi:anti-sigma factor RsiW